MQTTDGIRITLDDQNEKGNLILETPGGQKVTFQEDPGRVVVEDGNGNFIELQGDEVRIFTPGNVIVTASEVQVSAGMLKVDAGMSEFTGTVKCDTIIANSVVGSSYAPGAGNVW